MWAGVLQNGLLAISPVNVCKCRHHRVGLCVNADDGKHFIVLVFMFDSITIIYKMMSSIGIKALNVKFWFMWWWYCALTWNDNFKIKSCWLVLIGHHYNRISKTKRTRNKRPGCRNCSQVVNRRPSPWHLLRKRVIKDTKSVQWSRRKIFFLRAGALLSHSTLGVLLGGRQSVFDNGFMSLAIRCGPREQIM